MMLKLLRDDLRQIIDSGSSIGSKVPENPKIWVAPVRHRFSQLMDEMDIHSKWDFPNEWAIEPNSLQCLTLMRVLEESLTNVIKHSQAKHVSVSMQFVPPMQLILKVQDDGVGFEANSVLEHGMSIGIRSMKMRLDTGWRAIKIKFDTWLYVNSGSFNFRSRSSKFPQAELIILRGLKRIF